MCACTRERVCAYVREGDFRPPLFKIVIPCPYFFHFAQDRAANSPLFLREKQSLHLSLFLIFEDDENEGERILLCSFL